MAKKLPKETQEIIAKYGLTQSDVWDCHNVWVIYHKALERIAASNGIVFERPEIICADIENQRVAILVTGTKGDASEWSIGEAAPYNSKNSYPFAMAEKRAKDRVILKLLGLHGDFYSEEEADEFKEDKKDLGPSDVEGIRFSGPAPKLRSSYAIKKDNPDEWDNALKDMRKNTSAAQMEAWKREVSDKYADWPDSWSKKLEGLYQKDLTDLQAYEEAAQ